MTPDELRALAEALDRLKFRCDGIDDACLVEDAADFLRQCAEQRPCTCHPDDNPPVPCAQKYALSECRAASEPTEAQRLEGAIYGIIDPDYGRVYTITRKLAWEEGYAIGLHGSFTRDLDLIAVPWAERACEAEHLIRRIVDATGLRLSDGVGVKPHGRRAWTLLFPAFGDPRFVDLSVMPRIGGSDAE